MLSQISHAAAAILGLRSGSEAGVLHLQARCCLVAQKLGAAGPRGRRGAVVGSVGLLQAAEEPGGRGSRSRSGVRGRTRASDDRGAAA